MIKISKKSQYGLRAMVLLAKKYNDPKGTPQILSVREISKQEAIPFEFLEKIILQLEKVKLVKSKKGVLGGYILSRSPKKISAKNIVNVLEKNKKAVDCTLCGKKSKCLTKNVWMKVESALNNTLDSITLESLIS
jgi:Rrf2 family cysteine metabolism transcriptional repressor